VHWLGVLGKWSMLDVFVVAITIVITKISSFAKAEARLGLYFFGASIMLAMLATGWIERIMKKNPHEK
jgi:paraquat-inducible protein A